MRFFPRGVVLAISIALVVSAGCDAGSGTSTFLTPGDPTSAAPGDLVLYTSLSNGDRVVGYRLGADGLMPPTPFTSIELENPRAIALGDGVLYVMLEDRVVALSLGSDGSLPLFPSSQSSPIRGAEGVDLLLADDILYAAFQELQVVMAFALESGQVTPQPLSASGTSTSDYRSMAIGDGFLYAGSFGGAEIDTYIIQPDGSLPEEPEPQEPLTEIFRPEDMLVANGVLYSICQSRERIEGFNIRANGLLPEEFDTNTADVQRYNRLLLDGERLYATGAQAGRIDMYVVLPNGDLPETDPVAQTASDPAAYPTGMVLNEGILYVAQAGLGRIDAYILGSDGAPAEFPSSSTDSIEDSFPAEVAIGSFPE